MLGSCVGVALLAMLHESLKVMREYVDVKSERKSEDVNSRRKTDDSCCGSCTTSTDGCDTTATHGARGHKRCVYIIHVGLMP